MNDHGAPLLAIKDGMGHDQVSSTEIYVRISNKQVREAILTHHPRAKKPSKPVGGPAGRAVGGIVPIAAASQEVSVPAAPIAASQVKRGDHPRARKPPKPEATSAGRAVEGIQIAAASQEVSVAVPVAVPVTAPSATASQDQLGDLKVRIGEAWEQALGEVSLVRGCRPAATTLESASAAGPVDR